MTMRDDILQLLNDNKWHCATELIEFGWSARNRISEMRQDRITRANRSLTVKAYIVPEYAAVTNNTKRHISIGKVSFGEVPSLSGNSNAKKRGNE